MDQIIDKLPLVSVILPVFNGGTYLKCSIQSILNQTLNDFEFIIIDDGSTDGSAEILQGFASGDKRIRLIQRPNKGLVFSLNEGLSLARGKFIARMDSDDFSHPERLKAQVELLERQDADVCGCHFKLISASNKLLSAFIAPINQEAIACTLLTVPPFAHGAVMFRADFLKKHKLQYTDVAAEDHLLWTQLWVKTANFVTVDEFLFDYRVHAASISKAKTKASNAEVKQNAKWMLKKRSARIRESIEKLSAQELSEFDEQVLLIASYKYTLHCCSFLFFKCMKRVSKKSLLLVIFKILTGSV